MRNLNKYHWLAICSIFVFIFMYLTNIWVTNNIKDNSNSLYPLKVIDNEIRKGDTVLYRFIPVDGGSMEFTYRYILQREKDGKIDSFSVYNSKRIEISNMLIGETPVTEYLWEIVMNDDLPNNYGYYSIRMKYVHNKDTCEWKKFIEKLEKKTGREFALPNTYEWEYAARGGQKSKGYKYAGSNDVDEVALYSGNTKSENDVIGKTKATNELGLYDMSGGVRELTSTRYGEVDLLSQRYNNYVSYHSNSYLSRGGSFRSSAEECATQCPTPCLIPHTGARLILKY